MIDDTKTVARCTFLPSDLLTPRPNWTDAQCDEWLQANRKYIEEAMSVAGWRAIEDLLPTNTCKKCACHLDAKGYCLDYICPYNDWPQQVDLADMQEMCAIKLEEKYGIRKRSSRHRE